MNMKNPVVGVWGNALLLLLNNFVPPFFPLAGWWNQHALSFCRSFWWPDGRISSRDFKCAELPTEDWAGIGFGVSVLLLVSVPASFLMGRSQNEIRNRPADSREIMPVGFDRAVVCAAGLWHEIRHGHAAAAHRALLSVAAAAAAHRRGAVANHPPPLVAGAGRRGLGSGLGRFGVVAGPSAVAGQNHFVRSAGATSRPALARPRPESLHRLCRALRPAGRRPRAAAAGIKVVGFIGTEDDCDISLWRPFGERRVEHFFLTDPPEQIRQQVQYVVVGGFNLKEHGTALDTWLQSSGAELIATTNATLKVAEGLQPWYVVRFKP